MALIETFDPGNKYSVPYLWGTTGIGYNVDLVKKYLGDDAPVDSWQLLFNKDNLSKLSKCGVAFLDAPTEVFPATLKSLGLNPNSVNKADYATAEKALMEIRPHITYFNSSRTISDLANGDVCISLSWSGDLQQAAYRAEEAENGVNLAYTIPREGAGMYFDMFGIPKDADNVEEAYEFINFVLEGQVMADIQNYVAYASAVTTATPHIDEEIVNNPGIYPPDETKKKLFTFDVLPQKIDRLVNRSFTRVKTGQ